MNQPKYLIVHHEAPPTVVSGDRFDAINQYHFQRFGMKSSLGFYVGYHYFIEKTGKVIQARADFDEGTHTIGKNLESLGICLAGNFDLELPTEAQKISLADLLIRKSIEYNIPRENIVPHRTFSQKSCYGSRLDDGWARELINNKEIIKKQIINLVNIL